jgi:hypothetical protein
MPKTKSVETGGKVPDTCILKMGRNNNVIQWREEMYNLATEEFGEVGTYFYFYSLKRANTTHISSSPNKRPSHLMKRTMKTTKKTTTMSKRTSESWRILEVCLLYHLLSHLLSYRRQL